MTLIFTVHKKFFTRGNVFYRAIAAKESRETYLNKTKKPFGYHNNKNQNL